MANLETGELQLDLAPPASALPVGGPFEASAEVLRRTLHDGRLRSALIFIASVGVAAAFERTPSDFIVTCILFTVSWTFSTYLAERSLRTIWVVAGRGRNRRPRSSRRNCDRLRNQLLAASDRRPHRGHLDGGARLLHYSRRRDRKGSSRGSSEQGPLRRRPDDRCGFDRGARRKRPDPIHGGRHRRRRARGGVSHAARMEVPVLGSVGDLQRIVRETASDLVVVATDRGRP